MRQLCQFAGNLSRPLSEPGDRLAVASGQLVLVAPPPPQRRLVASEARDLLEECRPRFKQRSDQERGTAVRQNLGEIAREEGKSAEAIEHFRAAARHAWSLRDDNALAAAIVWLAALSLDGGDRAESAKLLAKIERLSETDEVRLSASDSRLYRATCEAIATQRRDPSVDSAWGSGRSMTTEQAIELALRIRSDGRGGAGG